ncbi:MAG TPA: BamA/TamA family outer membrane protein, partial [Kofleriaceae bacterium]
GSIQPMPGLPELGDLPHDPPPVPPPKPSGTFSIGAGFSSDESFIAAATIAQPDLFGTGSLLMMHARISAKRQLFLQRFVDPDLFGSPFALGVDLYVDKRERYGFTREAAGGSLTLSHRFAKHTRAFVGYRLEDVKVTSDASVPRTIDPTNPSPPLTSGILSALRAGIVYDSTDRSGAPLHGTVFGTSAEISERRLGSDFDFIRTDTWLQHHRPIGPFTLHLSGSLSTIGSPSYSTIEYGRPQVALSERLFLGSSQEIRGYDPDSFGPIDALGRPIGGNAKLLGSVELEAPLVRRIGLSAFGFADAGGLFTSGQHRVGRSVGFGLLWRSPIGPLKLSWALPLDGTKPGFVFGFGTGF